MLVKVLEGSLIDFACVEDTRNTTMRDRASGSSLTQEPRNRFTRVAPLCAADYFQRHAGGCSATRERSIERLEDAAERSAPKFARDFISTVAIFQTRADAKAYQRRTLCFHVTRDHRGPEASFDRLLPCRPTLSPCPRNLRRMDSR